MDEAVGVGGGAIGLGTDGVGMVVLLEVVVEWTLGVTVVVVAVVAVAVDNAAIVLLELPGVIQTGVVLEIVVGGYVLVDRDGREGREVSDVIDDVIEDKILRSDALYVEQQRPSTKEDAW